MSEETHPDRPLLRDELRTPLQIDNRMEYVLFYIRKATGIIGNAKDGLRKRYVDAKDEYERAFKQHKIDNLAEKGTVDQREDRAQLANWDLYRTMNEAKEILSYAQDKKADLEKELSKLQSESKLVIKEMELAGKGAI